ncbi:hypothetical protein TNCT_212021 [Trichonephila clavata]|uniref:Uncharacterized protein n=1 Tax=Trichonephila clavata TaxID=2740835 RepID=A0A8X6EWU2_TRICU|nr:hypothetical protein TNCT_212021 [Trichonephila clavata]
MSFKKVSSLQVPDARQIDANENSERPACSKWGFLERGGILLLAIIRLFITVKVITLDLFFESVASNETIVFDCDKKGNGTSSSFPILIFCRESLWNGQNNRKELRKLSNGN